MVIVNCDKKECKDNSHGNCSAAGIHIINGLCQDYENFYKGEDDE